MHPCLCLGQGEADGNSILTRYFLVAENDDVVDTEEKKKKRKPTKRMIQKRSNER